MNVTVNPTEPGLLAPASFTINGTSYAAAFFLSPETIRERQSRAHWRWKPESSQSVLGFGGLIHSGTGAANFQQHVQTGFELASSGCRTNLRCHAAHIERLPPSRCGNRSGLSIWYCFRSIDHLDSSQAAAPGPRPLQSPGCLRQGPIAVRRCEEGQPRSPGRCWRIQGVATLFWSGLIFPRMLKG